MSRCSVCGRQAPYCPHTSRSGQGRNFQGKGKDGLGGYREVRTSGCALVLGQVGAVAAGVVALALKIRRR